MAWLGLTMLRALSDGPKLTAELASAIGVGTDNAHQACRCLRARGLMRTAEGLHELTEAGRQAVECGEEITCGPSKGRVRRDGSLRAKAWRAMRIRERFSLDDLLLLLCDDGADKAERNLRDYLSALERSGHLTRLKRQGANGSPRWWLARDTGPKAPAWNKRTRTLADPNTGEIIPIPAQERRHG